MIALTSGELVWAWRHALRTRPSFLIVRLDVDRDLTALPTHADDSDLEQKTFKYVGRGVLELGNGERMSFATGDPMSQDAFKAKAYLKVGCPYSFKFLLFSSEARLLDSMDIVRCDPQRPEFEEIKTKLEQVTLAKASFPTVEVEPGVYKTDSDELIEYYARRNSVADEKLPALAFYKQSIFPQLLECHE